MKTLKLAALLCMVFSNISFAKAQSNQDYLVKEWERARDYTKEYLEAMPESGYASKPTADMRSFAAQMLHLADANYEITAGAAGKKSPFDQGEEEKSSAQSKIVVTKIVLDSYDYVIEGIKSLSPAQLNESIRLFGKFDLTRAQVFEKDFEHQTHQRAQTIAYLHLAGVKVPKEKIF